MQGKYAALHKASQKGAAVLILFSHCIMVRPFLLFFCTIQPLNVLSYSRVLLQQHRREKCSCLAAGEHRRGSWLGGKIQGQ